ncbi:MAG: alpha/beta fold hydrolase [Polyangiaceae bacterium]
MAVSFVTTRLLVGALALAACADDSATSAGGSGGAPEGGAGATGQGGSAGGGGGEGGAPSQVDWASCPLYLDQPNGAQAECATIEAPLRWSEPDGPQIGVFVQRLRAPVQPSRGQVWLLEGGPGGSGADFDKIMAEFQKLDPTLDFYAIDHRGVGRSARLSCPGEDSATSAWGTSVSPEEAPACRDEVLAAWGDDLDEFTTTSAARDLGWLIDRTAEPGRDVFVYGVSYGTYWAIRYLQLFPNQATAVVLDSIAPPGESFLHYDEDFDAVGQDFMDLCATDPLCAAKLGADPWGATKDVLTLLDGGHCAELATKWGLNRQAARTVFAYLLTSTVTRAYFPAFVYRLARCDAADVTALDHLLGVLFGNAETSYYATLSSDALFYNVALSELWPDASEHPTVESVSAIEDALSVSTGLTPRVTAVQDVWPAYEDDSFVGQWPDTQIPVLMMNGDLDPMTPIWVGGQAAQHFTGPQQWFYRVPRAAHAVIVETPGDEPCGRTILFSFLADPTKEPDTTCLEAIPEESFAGDPPLNNYLLGTADLWENAAALNDVGEPSAATLAALRDRLGRY